MFLPVNGDKHDGRSPKEMTAREIALTVTDTVQDTDLHEAMGLDETVKVDKKQVEQMRKIVYELCQTNPAFKNMTKDTILGFRSGVAYGMGFMVKITQATDNLNLEKPDPEKIKKVLFKFLTPFLALDAAAESFNEDAWLENLLKNAKVEPEPVKTVKKTGKKKTK